MKTNENGQKTLRLFCYQFFFTEDESGIAGNRCGLYGCTKTY
jgi:hypothetical protein